MCACVWLPHRYEAALQQLQEDQRQIDRRVARGGFRSKDRDMALQVRARVAGFRLIVVYECVIIQGCRCWVGDS